MNKVMGSVKLTVFVECPKCGEDIDLIENDCENDYIVSNAIYQYTTESCTDMGIECECPECGHEFILDSVEY